MSIDEQDIKDLLNILDSQTISVDFNDLVSKPMKQIAESNTFIEFITLSDESGIMLAGYSRFSKDENYLIEVLAPSSAILIATAGKVSSKSKIEETNTVTVEGKGGGIITTSIKGEKSTYILTIQYKGGAPKGLIIRDLNNLRNMIEEVLKRNGLL